MTARTDINVVKSLFESKGYVCLFDSYIHNKQYLLVKCCNGHLWNTKYNNIQQGNGCPECAGLNKKDLKIAQELAISRNGKCLSNEYINNKSMLLWECSKGHHWEASLNAVYSKGNWCAVCGKSDAKKTCLERYGVDNPTKNKEIALKAARTANQIVDFVHWFSNEKVPCRGSYEIAVVTHFNNNKIDYNWQPQTFLMPNNKTYTPDCYLSDQDLWIEIKGYFWEDALEKWEWFHKEHPNSELWDKRKLKEMGIL